MAAPIPLHQPSDNELVDLLRNATGTVRQVANQLVYAQENTPPNEIGRLLTLRAAILRAQNLAETIRLVAEDIIADMPE